VSVVLLAAPTDTVLAGARSCGHGHHLVALRIHVGEGRGADVSGVPVQ
jgi:hypothetical protein